MSEGWHPRRAPNRLRRHLAVYGLVVAGVLGFFAWRADITWLAVVLWAVAVLALADLIRLAVRARRFPGA